MSLFRHYWIISLKNMVYRINVSKDIFIKDDILYEKL